MSKLDKIIGKFWRNPDLLTYANIEKVLLHYGSTKIDAKGSHVKFKHSASPFDLIIPIHGKDCKPFYKKQALKFLQPITSKPTTP